MDDLAEAIHSRPDLLFMGGGNPANIPAITESFSKATESLLSNQKKFSNSISAYSDPAGYTLLRERLCEIINEFYNWNISLDNIMLTNGSQAGFHLLFNLFNQKESSVLFPQVPDYIGYSDLTGNEETYLSIPAVYKSLDDYTFGYALDRVSLEAALAQRKLNLVVISQPTNPTGGILSQEDFDYLVQATKKSESILLLDHAYGGPFPAIQERLNVMDFEDHCIYSFSLSKLGFPGGRVGIFISSKSVISQMVEQLTITSLAPNSIGPAIASHFFSGDNWRTLIRDVIKPYYQRNRNTLINELKRIFSVEDFEYYEPEGAFFLWVRFKKFSRSQDLYRKLKEGGLLVVPGDFFYFGKGLNRLEVNAPGCYIRISYVQSPVQIQQSIALLKKILKS
jgi:valine--pyruvate aminotransferase